MLFVRFSFALSLVLFCLGACASSGDDASAGSSGSSSSSGGSGGSTGGGGSAGSDGKKTFYVEGRDLRDPCGNKVVLRGVNEMIVWSSDKTGASVYKEIAKTGANVVRIVWSAKGSSAADLDKTISNALDNKLIPMVENHDPTGDITKIPAAVDYWTKSEVVEVLQKYADKILLNIGNEAGGSVSSEDFESTYATAIKRLRDAGYTFPLIVDSTSWGTNIMTIFDSTEAVVASDPLKNTMLSIHLYWDDADGALSRRHLTDVAKKNLPVIVGEFASTRVTVCKNGSYNYRELMAVAQENAIGWLAWSWGAVKNSDCAGLIDMTSDGTFDGLVDWGLEVATTDANSIKNTSVRSPYIEKGSCD